MEFEKLYTAYFHDVFVYIRRLSNDEHIAEEITSETFFKAMKAIDRFRGDCDVRVWLCQIAKNCYYSYLKKVGRTDFMEDLAAEDAGIGLEEQFVRRDQATQLRRILHDMPAPYKEVFMWRVFAELSFQQIGQIFGKSGNWACVTYHRARKQMRERLEAEFHEE